MYEIILHFFVYLLSCWQGVITATSEVTQLHARKMYVYTVLFFHQLEQNNIIFVLKIEFVSHESLDSKQGFQHFSIVFNFTVIHSFYI